ncbi:MAG: thiamine diphosphokinase [bacterium]
MMKVEVKGGVRRFIIIGNGELDNLEVLRKTIKKNDLIIAVDGGADYVNKLSLSPDYIIGDLDSVKTLPKEDKSIQILKFSKEKDKTDTEIAIEFALKNKASEILLFGMTSQSRIDHSINNIFLLENLAKRRIKNTLFVNSFTRLSAVKRGMNLYRKDGDLVSLIPLTKKVSGIITEGLKYKLEKESLSRDKTRGISNIIIEKEAEIRFDEGVLLVIQIGEVARGELSFRAGARNLL